MPAIYPGKVGVQIAFDESLAHRVIAGSDLFLMPSRYEPSGLTQLYSLRYGTIPIVRATGGLKDTIEEFDPKTGKGKRLGLWSVRGWRLPRGCGPGLGPFLPEGGVGNLDEERHGG